jgi:hypothetical protein
MQDQRSRRTPGAGGHGCARCMGWAKARSARSGRSVAVEYTELQKECGCAERKPARTARARAVHRDLVGTGRR